MNEMLEAVLNSLWQAAAVTAAVWLLLRSMPHINAATRYAVWWAVLAVLVLLPIATEVGRVSADRPLSSQLNPPPAPGPMHPATPLTRPFEPGRPISNTPMPRTVAAGN